MTRIQRFNRGQLAIILNLAIPTLVAAIVLGLDAVTFFLNQIQLERAVGTAVAVGAVYLPSNPPLAIRAAQSYANLNGLKTSDIVSTRISSNRSSITMSARRPVSCYFARELGLAIEPISATATAKVATGSSRAGGEIKIGRPRSVDHSLSVLRASNRANAIYAQERAAIARPG